MLLMLDVGNSQIFGGVVKDDDIILKFRKVSKGGPSSDELGIFLKTVLRENGINPEGVNYIACCSVVPGINHSLNNACIKYFGITPFFLKAGVKTGLKILTKNPKEVGADRIASAVGAVKRFPETNMMIADFGTATTLDAVNGKGEYLGGIIMPGMKISMQSLESNTAKLPAVEILKPVTFCGKTTIDCIQSGLYLMQLGAVKEAVNHFTDECFGSKKPMVIATGGFARLFEDSGLFDHILSDLVLDGVYQAWKLNRR